MDASTTAPSAWLALANERLYQLRDEVRAQRTAEQRDVPPEALPCSAVGSPLLTTFPSAEVVNGLPVHLGWESAPVTAVLRRHWSLGRPTEAESAHLSGLKQPATTVECATSTAGLQAPADEDRIGAAVKLYPAIGLGMLRSERAAPGRLWLMCHHLDPEGRGVLRVDILREQLTQKTSANYLCGKRQLRNLLRAGEGVFWTRDKHERLWLHSAGRVAAALGVERLTGRPVALPLSALLSGIGEFRAHLYAAFHSGRAKGEGAGMPIARDTLATLSGVGGSSQRAYEARLRLRSQANYAVGEVADPTKKEERAWKQGEALFTLKDYRGEQGKQGRSYLAWQLPNSYRGQHQQRPKGRQKRINRHLRDLVMKGMPGNGGGTEETRKPEKRYYANGRSASQSRGPHIAEERYWRREGENGRSAIWHPLQGG